MGCAFCHGSGRPGSTFRQPTSFVRLSLGATRDFTFSFVSPRERERRQPGFATDGPEFVGRNQLVGCIQGPEVHFDLVPAASEDGRSAAGAEEPPGVVARFALDRHRVAREYRGGVEQGPVVLAEIQAVAAAGAVRRPRCRASNAAIRRGSRGESGCQVVLETGAAVYLKK